MCRMAADKGLCRGVRAVGVCQRPGGRRRGDLISGTTAGPRRGSVRASLRAALGSPRWAQAVLQMLHPAVRRCCKERGPIRLLPMEPGLWQEGAVGFSLPVTCCSALSCRGHGVQVPGAAGPGLPARRTGPRRRAAGQQPLQPGRALPAPRLPAGLHHPGGTGSIPALPAPSPSPCLGSVGPWLVNEGGSLADGRAAERSLLGAQQPGGVP